MPIADITLLDVGHGNSAVVRTDTEIAVVDTGLGGTLVEHLESSAVANIHHVLISHADQDHIGGLVGLLSSGRISVSNIYVNPDAKRYSKLWSDFLTVLADVRHKGTRVVNSLSTTAPGEISLGTIGLKVVAPQPELALAAIGGRIGPNSVATKHTINAVVSVGSPARNVVFLAGDLDDTALQKIRAEYNTYVADVLVFPHHGGLTGGNVVEFTEQLCTLVQPKLVVFSNGRGKHKTPRPEIVQQIRKMGIRLVCTQLSTWCAIDVPKRDAEHLLNYQSHGREARHCCMGTLRIVVNENDVEIAPNLDAHSVFVEINAPTALCRSR